MADLFGMPTPSVSDDYEWFGPYVVDGVARFWRYDVIFETWSVVDAGGTPNEVKTGAGVSIREIGQAQDAIETASLIPVPEYPRCDRSHVDTKWFAHAGWWFAWKMDRPHKEWQLQLIERA